ncbi:hypothetical protein EVAR_53727_1 [Eumeta japonica]|uniref:Uncharacterized protein n=1 Tax=Eumeta variegata TaxID=151549 RepID=A0A4C1Z2F4_EUMVA|nr:hypothetical protein EVAR_53727_1 [Eumeta japonica]
MSFEKILFHMQDLKRTAMILQKPHGCGICPQQKFIAAYTPAQEETRSLTTDGLTKQTLHITTSNALPGPHKLAKQAKSHGMRTKKSRVLTIYEAGSSL